MKKFESPIEIPPLRRPAQSLQQRIRRKSQIVFLILWSPIILYLGALIGIAGHAYIPHFIILLSLLPVGMYLLMNSWEKRQTETIDNWMLGRDGEIFVGEILNSFTEYGWKTLHDFQTGKVNIDHIIITPQGVFTIETKTVSKHPGEETISYDCRKVWTETRDLSFPFKQALAEAAYLGNLLRQKLTLKVFVQPIVTYPGWKYRYCGTQKLSECEVWVCLAAGLPKVIQGLPEILTAGEQTQIYNYLASENRE